jgi:hypothetical protein
MPDMTSDSPVEILSLTPTPLLREHRGCLLQRARLGLRCKLVLLEAVVRVTTAEGETHVTPVALAVGQSAVEVDVPEIARAGDLVCEVRVGDRLLARAALPWVQPRRWTVHIVQLSHHDVGYTDLASHVLQEHDRWLDAVIEMAVATRDFPEAARFRAVIEQAWSVQHYLRHASAARAAVMVDLLRSGDLELTALFGNLTTELCGHETLVRALYPAFHLRRLHGIPVVSAEHNDIPGFAWGLSQILIGAGIRFFCPGLPKYYAWGTAGVPSFWDETALFGAEGLPGAFWWEAPTGRRLLFWSNNQGCGGDCDPRLPGLSERLQQLQEMGYPYTVLRWPVTGAARDNSPYLEAYAHTIRDWNARWTFPRLISSTNARFYTDLLPQLSGDLPVFRGELPGQDYPVGAASTAAATAATRRTHTDLPAAEALAIVAGYLVGEAQNDTGPQHAAAHERATAAYEEVLWHDEHTWGHHFPAGPTACTAELEKAVHAYRAAALAHDISNKAMARIADAVHLDEPGPAVGRLSDCALHLVVFNPLPTERSALATTPLRELDNCGSTIAPTERGTLRGVLLHDRWHVNPPPEIVAGCFDLVDVATGVVVPWQLDNLDSPYGPQLYAAQRLGLGAGGKRYGFFEDPAGLARELSFYADSVPPLGYRTYRLVPRVDRPAFAEAVAAAMTTLESPFYRLDVDSATGFVRSLRDKESGLELIDAAAPHPFGGVLVRDPYGGTQVAAFRGFGAHAGGPAAGSLRATYSVMGHPHVEVTYTLYAHEKRLDLSVGLLKDPAPLLETYIAFPFDLPEGHICYEAPLCAIDPARDLLPGAYADRLAVQTWVSIADGRQSIIWTSRDAPVTSLARLWPGRVSPAHSAVVRAREVSGHELVHAPQTAGQLQGGLIYSLLTANNFGTNLAVTQSGALLFRYTMTSRAGTISTAEAAAIGGSATTPLSTIFTKHARPRHLPPAGGFLSVDPPSVRLVALKGAEAGEGVILRLWNPDSEPVQARISLSRPAIAAAWIANLVEEETGERQEVDSGAVTVTLGPAAVVTLRLIVSAEV